MIHGTMERIYTWDAEVDSVGAGAGVLVFSL